jgi:precorrin-6B methylase 2
LNFLRSLCIAAAAVATAAAAAPAAAQLNAGPYVPTPVRIVDEMLKMAQIRADDVVLDLGSGDGRIPIDAVARYGAKRGMGIDIDEKLVTLATANAAKAGVGDRVAFTRGDLFEMNLSGATVVTTYLLPDMVTRLVPKMLAELPAGARVVAHDYPLAPWPHDRVATMELEEKVAISGSSRTVIYHYTVPARIAGTWDVQFIGPAGRQSIPLTVAQRTGRSTAVATIGKREVEVTDFRVVGDKVWMSLPVTRGAVTALEGRVAGDVIEGLGTPRWRATRTGAPR